MQSMRGQGGKVLQAQNRLDKRHELVGRLGVIPGIAYLIY